MNLNANVNVNVNVMFVFLLITWSFVTNGLTIPMQTKMIYYQQPMSYYNGPQRMMYVQYVQPSRMFAHPMQAAEALVAGDRVAAGTYLNDCAQKETEIVATVDPATKADVTTNDSTSESHAYYENSAQSIAEAYPAGNVPLVDGIPLDVDVVPEENEISVYENAKGESTKMPDNYNSQHDGITESHEDNASTLENLPDEKLSLQQDNNQDRLTSFNDANAAVTASSENKISTDAIQHNDNNELTLPLKTDHVSFQQADSVPHQTYLPAKRRIDDINENGENDQPIQTNNKTQFEGRRIAKKKVFVELDPLHKFENDFQEPKTSKKQNIPAISKANRVDVIDNDDDETDSEENMDLDTTHMPTIPKNRNHKVIHTHQVTRKSFKSNVDTKSSRPKIPHNESFFPIEFGGTGSGGAIAIANSYSTGEGGTATSHAIAYGSPDAIRSRNHILPSQLH